MNPQSAPVHVHNYEEDHPPAVGLHSAIEGEEEHHEKMPVLKKVKEKVRKIKDTISKKKHGHGDDHDHGHNHDLKDEEEEEGYEENDEEIVVDQEVHDGPMYETGVGLVAGGQERALERERFALGKRFEQDPNAPKPRSEALTVGDQNRPSYPSNTGGEEVTMSPVLSSFQTMTVADQHEEQTEVNPSPPTGTHDQFSPEKTRPGPEERPRESGEPFGKPPSYTEKLSSTVSTAKDTAVSAAATVYEKVAGAGTAVMAKVQPSGAAGTEGGDRTAGTVDKGVSVREYLAEKLRPGEEDRALCEVISEAVHKRKEEAAAVETAEVTGSGEAGGGKGMVEKIRGAVTSFLGGSGVSGASPVTGAVGKGGEAVEGAHQETESRKQEEDIE